MGISNNILDYFPYETPRKSQIQVLQWVERNWNRYDVMVLQCPVAAGKSGLAKTICDWAVSTQGCRTGITTPDNVLVRQYVQDFDLQTLPVKAAFATPDHYIAARTAFKEAETKVMNNWTLLANRAYSEVQIMDEAHELIPMLQDFNGLSVWHHLDPYPKSIRTVADVLVWAASRGPKDSLGKKITKLLNKNPKDYVVVQEKEVYRNKERDRLRIYPLTPKNNSPVL